MSDYIKKQDVFDILYNTFEKYNMTTDKQDKIGGFGAEVFERVKDISTLDEKEIIRKAMERIIERLGRLPYADDEGFVWLEDAKDVVKEEGGIE